MSDGVVLAAVGARNPKISIHTIHVIRTSKSCLQSRVRKIEHHSAYYAQYAVYRATQKALRILQG